VSIPRIELDRATLLIGRGAGTTAPSKGVVCDESVAVSGFWGWACRGVKLPSNVENSGSGFEADLLPGHPGMKFARR